MLPEALAHTGSPAFRGGRSRAEFVDDPEGSTGWLYARCRGAQDGTKR